jgi:2-polyprenyl-3-methyl-5-hydroxy-6-metoxy-1,4-benzoquinol methylase
MALKTDTTQYEVGQADWAEAQQWEKAFWDRYVHSQQRLRRLACLKTLVKKVLKRGPDESSNLWWAQAFDQYRFVPDRLENVIEFGCGPSTNLRMILRDRQVAHVVASDPLARHYVTYKGYHLAQRWKRGEWLIDDHTMEESYFADNVFDLAVCINVLDHVRSVDLCMKTLVRVVKPGGLLILLRRVSGGRQAPTSATRTSLRHPRFCGPISSASRLCSIALCPASSAASPIGIAGPSCSPGRRICDDDAHHEELAARTVLGGLHSLAPGPTESPCAKEGVRPAGPAHQSGREGQDSPWLWGYRQPGVHQRRRPPRPARALCP